jgi:hypothetical protein
MEILDNQFTENTNEGGLQVTRDMKINWLSTSKWAMFLAVLGFIYAGITIIMAFAMGPMMTTMMTLGGQTEMAMLIESFGSLIIGLTVLAAAVTFFINLYQLRFSTNIQRSMQFDDQNAFEAAWRNLRLHFRLYGILLIAVIVLYVIAIIAVGSMAATGFEGLGE